MKYLKKDKVKYIVIHCSDTKLSQPCDAEIIDQWHIKRGFAMIGYHYVILPDGTVEHGRPLFYEGAHVKGHNHCSIGVCLVGGRGQDGRNIDTRTVEQQDALMDLLRRLKKRFKNAVILGHRDLDKGKVCPCFEAKSLNLWL